MYKYVLFIIIYIVNQKTIQHGTSDQDVKIAAAIEIQRVWRGYYTRQVGTSVRMLWSRLPVHLILSCGCSLCSYQHRQGITTLASVYYCLIVELFTSPNVKNL